MLFKWGETASGSLQDLRSTFNNIIFTLTKENGDKLVQVSPRSINQKEFGGTRKSTSYAAEKAAGVILAQADEYGIVRAKLKVRGVGPGRDAAVRKLCQAEKLQVEELTDMTGLKHGGCRPKKRPRK